MYLLACVLLLGGAVVLLVNGGYDLVMLRGDDEAAIEIGVLSALLLVPAVALFLLRREEREPEEA